MMDKAIQRKFNILVSGHGQDTLLLGNGFGTDHAFWNRLLPWLEAHHRVVRFDWPVEPVHYDFARYGRIESYVDDLLAVVGAVTDQPCALLAHSMSCMIGMLAARAKPDLFRRMVMLSPAPCYIDDGSYVGGFTNAAVGTLLVRIGENYIDWTEDFAPQVVGDPDNRVAIEEFSRGLLAMRPDIAFAMASVIFRMDLRDRLDGFTVPTTIIQPTDDPAVPVAVGRYLTARWPQAQLEIVEASGHLPHLTVPEKIYPLIEAALSCRDGDGGLPGRGVAQSPGIP